MENKESSQMDDGQQKYLDEESLKDFENNINKQLTKIMELLNDTSKLIINQQEAFNSLQKQIDQLTALNHQLISLMGKTSEPKANTEQITFRGLQQAVIKSPIYYKPDQKINNNKKLENTSLPSNIVKKDENQLSHNISSADNNELNNIQNQGEFNEPSIETPEESKVPEIVELSPAKQSLFSFLRKKE
ncbi:hypothetical protein [Bacillus salipaludis]|uniref:Uncharacterized protein n=1 Tax=Bacillus salipaludis TaxID=2547811 RepID=A0AA90TWG1_9BACI|nr:hypothetical protein [Bacillus salipaludis]MDQ6600736.1 hypothetical protein [Bacillus salipaludis]